MNDQLHHLLDGELPDGETAEYLRHLSKDTADRALFRQQMKLHGALYRNAGYDGMTTGEAGEMLDRLETAMGAAPIRTGTWRRGGMVAAAIIGAVVVGGGLGYITHDNISPRATQITVMPVSPKINLVTPPPVVIPGPSTESVTSQRSAPPRRSTTRRPVHRKSQDYIGPGPSQESAGRGGGGLPDHR